MRISYLIKFFLKFDTYPKNLTTSNNLFPQIKYRCFYFLPRH